MDFVGDHRQQNLSGASQLVESGEDRPHHFPDPQVGIESETDLAMPDVADRHVDAQFAAACLGAGSVEHAGTQHTELEFADAALHAEQQPIVRPTRVVNAVQVDHPRPDQTAEFEQVVPVAAVAGEPGRIVAQHRSNFPSAEPGREPLEPWSGHHPTGRPAEIVVDHLDISEPPAPRDVNKLVLPVLALKVGLNLRLTGLPNIDNRFALQHRRWEKITVRHRGSPPPPPPPPPPRLSGAMLE